MVDKNVNPNPLPPNLIVGRADGGMLLYNLAAFSSLLRSCGIGGGMRKNAATAAALSVAGVENRADVFWSLATVFVEKRGQLPLFRRAFDLFWRGADADDTAAENGGEFLTPQYGGDAAAGWHETKPEKLHAAAAENLRGKDFAAMSREEWAAAVQINETAAAALPPLFSRRKQSAARGKTDMRRTVRRALSRGGDIAEYRRFRRAEKKPRLIILADISGSMEKYSRAFLHFTAGILAGGKIKTNAFLLGTRLTALRPRGGDAESAAKYIAAAAKDWDGGTRLTPLLREFNRDWLRYCGAGNAVALFATDGLEVNFKDSAFAAEVERLQKSCRRLIWLNPLLRYGGYAPLARGAKILSQYANETYSIHNVRSIMQLAEVLRRPQNARRQRA